MNCIHLRKAIYEVKDGKIIIYVYRAMEGFIHELLAKDNSVCVESDFHRYVKTEHGVTTEYERVIGFGTAGTVVGDNYNLVKPKVRKKNV